MTRSKLAALAAVLAVALSACESADESTTTSGSDDTSLNEGNADTSAADADIEVHDNSFSPEAVEVVVGEDITWDFSTADQPHDVVFDADRGSDILESGTWSTSFDEPGTYAYECTLHSGMSGQVVVVDS